MVMNEDLLSFIAAFKGVAPEGLSLEAPLGLSSLAAQRFRSALKRKYGIDIPEKDFKTVSVQNILGILDVGNHVSQPHDVSSLNVTTLRPLPAPTEFGVGGVGIDMESVDEFRTSLDPQSDPFFFDTFTPAEMGYCLLQEDPAQHFAARFCAKEALRKCGSEYTNLAFNEIQIAHRVDGAPYYEIPHQNRELMHISLSLSHTGELAIAVAVFAGASHSDWSVVGPGPRSLQETAATKESIASGPGGNSSTVVNRKRIPQSSILLWVLMCLFVGESIVRIH